MAHSAERRQSNTSRLDTSFLRSFFALLLEPLHPRSFNAIPPRPLAHAETRPSRHCTWDGKRSAFWIWTGPDLRHGTFGSKQTTQTVHANPVSVSLSCSSLAPKPDSRSTTTASLFILSTLLSSRLIVQHPVLLLSLLSHPAYPARASSLFWLLPLTGRSTALVPPFPSPCASFSRPCHASRSSRSTLKPHCGAAAVASRSTDT